jgi:hypothetical protein
VTIEAESYYGISWGLSRFYTTRVHLVPGQDTTALCALPTDTRLPRRPDNRRICPECALTFIALVFPSTPQRS